jgi:hypothetical protein
MGQRPAQAPLVTPQQGIEKAFRQPIGGAMPSFGRRAHEDDSVAGGADVLGEGTMFGGAGINLDLLRAIRLQVAVARAAVVEDDPTAKALLLLIRDGRLDDATADPALRSFLDQLCASGDDFELVTELYNGHLWTSDPATQQRNLLAAAVAHFEARKPLDKIASLARASGATIQINIGTHQRNAGRDHRGR